MILKILLKLDVEKIDNQLTANEVEIGFAAIKAISDCLKTKKCRQRLTAV